MSWTWAKVWLVELMWAETKLRCCQGSWTWTKMNLSELMWVEHELKCK